ncbi:ATP-binding protein [Streptomyces sp. NBC_01515]|uniref:ATP-binding protein n=1 Tax=Streptomyces sp. NBC_01515 TaxID=2903890 RepID=UPI00386F38E0
MPSYTLICPPLDTSPHIARDFVATVLRTLELDRALVDDAILCTSELVTNACVHAKGGDGAVAGGGGGAVAGRGVRRGREPAGDKGVDG